MLLQAHTHTTAAEVHHNRGITLLWESLTSETRTLFQCACEAYFWRNARRVVFVWILGQQQGLTQLEIENAERKR